MHYFDVAVVAGWQPIDAFNELRRDDRVADYFMFSQLALAFHVRDIGAEDALIFGRYPLFCIDHLDQHAAEAGMPPVTTMARELSDALLMDYSLDVETLSGKVVYGFRSPLLGTVSTAIRNDAWSDDEAAARSIAESTARTRSARLVSDVAVARANRAALAQATSLPDEVLQLSLKSKKPTASDVAFELPLPVLESAPIKEILAFRRSEAAEFQTFRAALRTAINEQLKALPDGSAQDVADAVLNDVIEPALAAIDVKVTAAAELLTKRSVVSVSIGAVLASVGFLAFAPLTVPGIAIGASGLLATANDYLKDKRDVTQNDMYFLWKLSEKETHKHS